MTGFEELLFLARRYLGILLAALPWLLGGILFQSVVLPWMVKIRSSVGATGKALLPIVSRAFHPLLLASLLVAFRQQAALPLYFLVYATLAVLLLWFLAWVMGLKAGDRKEPGGSEIIGFDGVSQRLIQISYDHSVDLVFGAFLAAALHSLVGHTNLYSLIYPATLIAYIVGALGSIPPAAAGPVALSLLPVGQPSLTIAYLLGTTLGSYKVVLFLVRRNGIVKAAIVAGILLVVSVLLSSPVSWSTLELLS